MEKVNSPHHEEKVILLTLIRQDTRSGGTFILFEFSDYLKFYILNFSNSGILCFLK